MMEGKSITAAQVTSVSQEELDGIKDKMLTYMKEFQPVSKIDMLFLMLTNIIDQSTTLLFVGNGADELVETAFNVKCGENTVFLPGVVSRKKQLIAPLSAAIKE
jgi:manganese-dependent inorganic pyrophosphatase